jgi:glycosyltransferase involved in cell wall biosynthesis
MATVDVFVQCYNYGRFLREWVESVLAQEGVGVRVLVLDDCSTDDTPRVGRELAAADPRVEYRRHPANRGHVATYNEGVEWVAGDYCQLLSADDLLTTGALARAASLMDAHPEVGMTYGEPIRTETPDFASVLPTAGYKAEVIPGPTFLEQTCRECTNLVEAATAVVRTSVQMAAGGYRKELPHACDMEMWLRCGSLAAVGRIHAPQGFYRRHGRNMSDGYAARRDYEQVRAAFGYFFAEFGYRVPGRDELEALVRRGLATRAFFLANDAFDAADPALCTRLLGEAVALWPGVRGHRGWQRLRVKRALGQVWRTVRPLLGHNRQAGRVGP